MGEQFKIIEYSLIILFIVTASVFLISTSDLVSIFLSIELQSYGQYLLSTIYRDSKLATSGYLSCFTRYFCFTSSPSPFLFHSPLYSSGFSGKGKGKATEEEIIDQQIKDKQIKDQHNIDEPYDSSDSEFERDIERAKRESMLNKKGECSAQAESSSQGSKFKSDDKHNIDEPYYSSDSEFERDIERAKRESMLNKKAESSAQAESSSLGSKFKSDDPIESDMLNLKLLEDKALQKAIQHNDFKMQLDKDNVEDEVKLATLKPIKEEHDCIKYNINKIKQRLLDKGVNPDLNKDKSYSNSSYTESEGYSSVDEQKPFKRVKLAGNEETKTFCILPFTGSFS
jgi:hypothetical protein